MGQANSVMNMSRVFTAWKDDYFGTVFKVQNSKINFKENEGKNKVVTYSHSLFMSKLPRIF